LGGWRTTKAYWNGEKVLVRHSVINGDRMLVFYI
jgi:hypothetical protein